MASSCRLCTISIESGVLQPARGSEEGVCHSRPSVWPSTTTCQRNNIRIVRPGSQLTRTYENYPNMKPIALYHGMKAATAREW